VRAVLRDQGADLPERLFEALFETCVKSRFETRLETRFERVEVGEHRDAIVLVSHQTTRS
jgi:hypothetical protein